MRGKETKTLHEENTAWGSKLEAKTLHEGERDKNTAWGGKRQKHCTTGARGKKAIQSLGARERSRGTKGPRWSKQHVRQVDSYTCQISEVHCVNTYVHTNIDIYSSHDCAYKSKNKIILRSQISGICTHTLSPSAFKQSNCRVDSPTAENPSMHRISQKNNTGM
jgi:hypothetical protein